MGASASIDNGSLDGGDDMSESLKAELLTHMKVCVCVCVCVCV